MARLGELLLRERLIDEGQLLAAQRAEKEAAYGLAGALVHSGAIKEEQLVAFMSRNFRVARVQLNRGAKVDVEAAKLLPEDMARKHQVVPLARVGATLRVAMADPSNIFAIDDLKFLTGLTIEIHVATTSDIEASLERLYPKALPSVNDGLNQILGDFAPEDVRVDLPDTTSSSIVEGLAASAEAPIIRLVNMVLLDAIKRGASDIHIEPYEKSFRVRFRIDGNLVEAMQPPVQLKQLVVSRIKIMAALDISERRLPQDGRIKLKLGGNKEMDFRVSVLPTLFGEKVVMRLLDKGNLQLDMTKLGFEPKQLADFQAGIHKPFGIVLVTGPTGSGKTTTLYSALAELNGPGENISTAEDPVEFNLSGINQVQMHEDIGLNFAAALRSFLRQDPDIIMVGEIRDYETCEIAIKAALTGHLVLSTLHTNDAPATISRMLNMGVEPFLITAALNAIVAQRLVRRNCSACRVAIAAPAKEVLDELQVPVAARADATFMKGTGCEVCAGSGMKGRIAIYEVMTAGDAVKEAIIRGAPPSELKAVAVKHGLKTLRQSAITRLLTGDTTVEEISRVTAAD